MSKETALISVWDKTGIVEFALGLISQGWDILASGGTAKHLREAKVPVCDVADLIGGKAILGHRVVTLSREVFAGILARDTNEDVAELEALGVPRITLVCNDPYPLANKVRSGADLAGVLESLDIGGIAMLMAIVKAQGIAVSSWGDQAKLLEWMAAGRPDERQFKAELAARTVRFVANYHRKLTWYLELQIETA